MDPPRFAGADLGLHPWPHGTRVDDRSDRRLQWRATGCPSWGRTSVPLMFLRPLRFPFPAGRGCGGFVPIAPPPRGWHPRCCLHGSAVFVGFGASWVPLPPSPPPAPPGRFRPWSTLVDLGWLWSTVVDRGRPWSPMVDLGRPWGVVHLDASHLWYGLFGSGSRRCVLVMCHRLAARYPCAGSALGALPLPFWLHL